MEIRVKLKRIKKESLEIFFLILNPKLYLVFIDIGENCVLSYREQFCPPIVTCLLEPLDRVYAICTLRHDFEISIVLYNDRPTLQTETQNSFAAKIDRKVSTRVLSYCAFIFLP